MLFEDVRVGQILVDKDGNQFEVMEIDRMDDDLPVCLKLVKHIATFAVPGNEFEVMEPGQGFLDSEFWIDRELAPAQKEEFSVACIDVESLSLFVGEPKSPKTVTEVIKNVKHASLKASADEDNRNFKQSKACAEEEELRNIVHDMFVLPTPKEAKPVAPVNAKRPSIEEIREITAQAENADLDKALDEIYPKILEAAELGEHTVVLENDMVDSLKLQVYCYLSDAGFMVRELFMGDSFEIKW